MPPGRTGTVNGSYYGLELTPEEEALLYGDPNATPPPPADGGYATEPAGGNDSLYTYDSPDTPLYGEPGNYRVYDPSQTAAPYMPSPEAAAAYGGYGAQPFLPDPNQGAALPPQSSRADAANEFQNQMAQRAQPVSLPEPESALNAPELAPQVQTAAQQFVTSAQRNNAGIDNITAEPTLNNRPRENTRGSGDLQIDTWTPDLGWGNPFDVFLGTLLPQDAAAGSDASILGLDEGKGGGGGAGVSGSSSGASTARGAGLPAVTTNAPEAAGTTSGTATARGAGLPAVTNSPGTTGTSSGASTARGAGLPATTTPGTTTTPRISTPAERAAARSAAKAAAAPPSTANTGAARARARVARMNPATSPGTPATTTSPATTSGAGAPTTAPAAGPGTGGTSSVGGRGAGMGSSGAVGTSGTAGAPTGGASTVGGRGAGMGGASTGKPGAGGTNPSPQGAPAPAAPSTAPSAAASGRSLAGALRSRPVMAGAAAATLVGGKKLYDLATGDRSEVDTNKRQNRPRAGAPPTSNGGSPSTPLRGTQPLRDGQRGPVINGGTRHLPPETALDPLYEDEPLNTHKKGLQSDDIIDEQGDFTRKGKEVFQGRGYLNADGTWGQAAADAGIIDQDDVGWGASWMDMKPPGSKAEQAPAEATDADVSGTVPVSGQESWANGNTWNAPASGGSGGNWRSTGGGGGRSWDGGSSFFGSGGGGGGFDFDAFFGPDFMGGRFRGAGDYHDFLEDLNGDGKFDASEIKAAKRRSRKGGKSTKMGRAGKGRRGALPALSMNSPIRADLLRALEDETGRRHGGWPEGRPVPGSLSR